VFERSEANEDLPIFMAHGIEDPIVPLKLAQASCTRLLTAGYPVEWHEYSMTHTVSREEMEDVGKWMRRVLAA